MLKLLPLLGLIAYGLIAWRLSTWRLKRELAAKSRPLDDPTLEALVKRLGRAVDQPAMRAHVYEVPAFNGLAAPDGRVFVTRGVLERYRRGDLTAEEVASIIAHELGHVALGHSRRRMVDWTGQNALRWVLSAALGRLIPFIGPWIAQLVASLAAARLSRRDEYEADAFAAALMRRARLDPRAQIDLLRKLEGMTPRGGGAVAWLMSHPAAPDRVRALQALHDKWDAQGAD